MQRAVPQDVFFRFEGDEEKNVFFRIRPTAVRFQQATKGSATNTQGGYYRELLHALDPQYAGLQLPQLTIEGTTGAGYRKEIETLDWIRRHQGQRRADHTLPSIYFYDLIELGPLYGEIERDRSRAYLIQIDRFSADESIQSQFEIRFSFACTILRDLFWGIDDPLSPSEEALVQPLPESATVQPGQ